MKDKLSISHKLFIFLQSLFFALVVVLQTKKYPSIHFDLEGARTMQSFDNSQHLQKFSKKCVNLHNLF